MKACEICHYYPGYKLHEVTEMDEETFETLMAGIEVIESKKTLIGFQVNDFPTLKQSVRERVHRNLQRIAFPDDFKKSIVRTDQLQAAGVSIGNIADHVKRK